MKPSQPFWPRGLLAGALLAALLIIPAVVVMMFDAAAGTARITAADKGQFLQGRRTDAGRSTPHAPLPGNPRPPTPETAVEH